MSERSPGQWPVDQLVDLDASEQETADAVDLYVQRASEQALHEMVLDSIRHDLEQQPSPLTVITAARTWCNRITAAAAEIAQAKRRTA
ncbi:hypothetical protein [Streptomyces sp. NPDC005549]|uniref:hypothetical protein n=1 Tax=Streptomyces sp. NPDC005549 TaxID=3154888 RepID=UPI0033AFCE94